MRRKLKINFTIHTIPDEIFVLKQKNMKRPKENKKKDIIACFLAELACKQKNMEEIMPYKFSTQKQALISALYIR